jgi:hypothetical protein
MLNFHKRVMRRSSRCDMSQVFRTIHQAGAPLKPAQEILGYASERNTPVIYTHSMPGSARP